MTRDVRHSPTSLALVSAVKGWACVWLLFLLVSTVKNYDIQSHTLLADSISILLLYVVATGIVTFLATGLFIPLYVSLVTLEKIARKPWRMYLETTVIAMICTALLTPLLKAQVDSFLITFLALSTFAVGVSVLGSFFFLRSLKMAKCQTD